MEKLTKKDVEKIKAEINKRKLEIRPQALEDVKTARAQGDLSENFEYYAAKKFNRENNSRIEYLENLLKNAEIIEDEIEDNGETKVSLDNKFTILFYEDDKDEDEMDKETYKLVTSIRADSVNKKISIESPLGKAVLNKKIGEIATVVLENGSNYQVKVIDIVKDDSEDEINSF